MLQNIKENFWLYILMILIVIWIVTLGWCSKQPKRFNLDKNLEYNISLYCEDIREDKEFNSICIPYNRYNQVECEIWDNPTDCEKFAQEQRTIATTEFSKLINKFYDIPN